MFESEENVIVEEQEKKKEKQKKLLKLSLIVFLVIIGSIGYVYKATCIFGHSLGAPATCVTNQTCKKCGEVFQLALGHNWIKATCTEPRTCSRCGKTLGSPDPHNIINPTAVTKAPTCTEAGTGTGTCSVCNQQNVTGTIPATGHTLGKWEISKQATLISAGEKIQKCTVCGQVINKDSYELTSEEIQAIQEKQELQKKQQEQQKQAIQEKQKLQKKQQEQQKLKNTYPITILSQDVNYISYDNKFHYDLNFRIKNNSSSDISIIKVKAELCDSNGTVVTSGNDYIYDLPVSQSKEGEVSIGYSSAGLRYSNIEVVEVYN